MVKLAGGVVIHRGKILIGKRKEGDSFSGFWEFPGGKVEKGENFVNCVKREMKEELGIDVSVQPSMFRKDVLYKDKIYRFSFHKCRLTGGNPVAKEVAEFKWTKPAKLLKYKFPPANYKLIKFMLEQKILEI